MPSKTPLGLYFNDNFAEISQVSSDGLRLEKFNQMVLPAGIVINSEIKNENVFTEVLRQLMSTARPSPVNTKSEVVIGVNDNRVFLREFLVPNVPGNNINDAIEYQVRALLPVLPTGVETDWQIIGKNEEGQIEVLLAAIPKNIIESYVSVCGNVGLKVVGIEPAVFANIRIINPTLMQGKNQLLVYLGDTYGVFSYITSGNPRFSDFLPQSEIEKDGDIVKTILAYINFANTKHPNRPVEEILISGSRQDTEPLLADLKSKNMTALKAVSRLAKTAVVNHSLLHTAHGLSLKLIDETTTVNLLPVEHRMEVIKMKLYGSWKTVLLLLILLTLAGLGGLGYLYRNAIDTETRLKVVKSQYEDQLGREGSQTLIKQADKLNQISGQLTLLRSVTGGEENILKELSAITPTGMVLSSLVISRNPTGKKLAEPGSSWILTGTANSRPLVLVFYRNLISSPEFSDGKLYFGSLEKDTGLTFRIAGQPKP